MLQHAQSSLNLPLLDLRQFDQGPFEREKFLSALRAAARDVGFFYLTGHGIPDREIDGIFRLSRQLFDLPEPEKLAIEMVNSPHFRGYTRAGWEITRGRQDWREQIDIGTELPALPRHPDLPAWTRLQGPNQWPEAIPEFRNALLEWQASVTDLAVRVLRAFALSLGQPEDVFSPIYNGAPNRLIKLIRYPGRDLTSDDQGVGPHKDSGFLTLLLQDRQKGLQVETEQGWIDAEPIPGVFVVNIGELLELASNGYLRATVHRVITPPANTDRISVAFFMGARLDATVPLLDLSPELAAEASGPTADPLNPLFREVGRNYLKGRLRSHPDVAQRHHADLLEQFVL
ncbi:isopenicillin N synthase family dioxygenase [Oceanibaculum pacificum]|uniref:2-oxoglutarate-dependent ethylene/succinate-forming enzyme n=1 Tax=Oceanibaculum pacificum TaxID=580166 RepID=A0A154W1G2_9PROT|nr:isopenicillin N synthase family oxygenase [Oceanibaculum pacificum]KZD07394.1 2-oxobutyrate oxidase [Oceanibaculum pacificum]